MRKITHPGSSFSRRAFLKLGGLGVMAAALVPDRQDQFPQAERLGRIAVGKVDVKAAPSVDSQTVSSLYQDAVVPWLREVVGYNPYRLNQRWIESTDGYIWAANVQPVRNNPSQPVDSLPGSGEQRGMWAIVSVPHVNLTMANPPARAPWLKARLESGLPPRFFYSQVVWIDDRRVRDDGQVEYRLNEQYGYGDLFWAPAETLRPLEPQELESISPQVEDKRILVDVGNQTLSCFENQREVYFCRVSTGALYNADGERVKSWGTPGGRHRIWRKAVSLPLSGGSATFGWDLPAVGWVALFVGTGVAIHSTYWHNNYGEPSSRGCVNASPEDAHWIFRWTNPTVPYDPGDVTVGMPGGTTVEVVDI